MRRRLIANALGCLAMIQNNAGSLLVLATILGFSVVAGRSLANADDEGLGEPYACASRSDIVGPCFNIRGRLSYWNGAPSARIWPVGTKRLIGVHFDVLPPALEAEMIKYDPRRSFYTEVWADFRLCPFTRYREGRMQFACIEAWHNVTFRHRKE